MKNIMIEQVKLVSDPEEVKRLYDLVKQYPLDYPDYSVWLENCKRQLEIGDKKAFYAATNGSLFGGVIFQRHREEDSVLEVKNYRILGEQSNKGVGSMLELMVCSYGRSAGFKRIRLDIHHNNFALIQFFIRRGYFIEGEEFLYTPDKPELILAKDL